MTYSPLQLEIIKTFGSKELSEGCLVICNDLIIRTIVDDCEFTLQTNGGPEWNYQGIANEDVDIGISEILGHIPHLNDLYRVAESKDLIIKIEYNYLKQEYVGITIDNTFGEDDIYALIPYNPTLPLIDQDPQLTLIPLLSLIK